jgi:aminopeptidase N/puromycin-sensitive aminopeptidase
MANKPLAALHPEWYVDQYVAGDEDSTLDLDAQPTTRAIRAKAETPDEINEMFDGIAYGKAGDVLLMVENYVGPETFRQGVRAYLSAHLYSNATAEDFWSAQTTVSHKPVDRIMDSLVAQPGVPIVTFGQPAGGTVSIEQKRFFLSPGIRPDPRQKWTLPVCFITGVSGKPDCQLLTPAASTLKVPAAPVFFANAAGKGYYRSAYPPSVYAALVAGIETSLSPPERIDLIGDEWAQARADKATVGDYLSLAAQLRSDTNALVVSSAIGGVGTIVDQVAATPEEKAALAAWIRRTFAPEYAKLAPPSPGDTANTRKLRSQLFGFLGYYGKDPAVLAEANRIAEKYLADPTSVEPAFGQTALEIAARNGDASLFDKLQKVYETSNNPEFQEGALRLLAEFENPELVKRSLEYDLSGKVRNQDIGYQLSTGLQADASREITWKFIKANWDNVQAQLTTEFGAYVVGSTASFCSAEARDDVQSFFSIHKVAAAERALKHATEQIDGCIEFRSLQEPNLKQWLAAQPAQ